MAPSLLPPLRPSSQLPAPRARRGRFCPETCNSRICRVTGFGAQALRGPGCRTRWVITNTFLSAAPGRGGLGCDPACDPAGREPSDSGPSTTQPPRAGSAVSGDPRGRPEVTGGERGGEVAFPSRATQGPAAEPRGSPRSQGRRAQVQLARPPQSPPPRACRSAAGPGHRPGGAAGRECGGPRAAGQLGPGQRPGSGPARLVEQARSAEPRLQRSPKFPVRFRLSFPTQEGGDRFLYP